MVQRKRQARKRYRQKKRLYRLDEARLIARAEERMIHGYDSATRRYITRSLEKALKGYLGMEGLPLSPKVVPLEKL
jgi:hypothetical protein